MIIVLGHLDTRPEDRDRLVELSAEAVRLARRAPGCLDFAVSADSVDPARVNVAERWASAEELGAFRGSGPQDDAGALIRDFHIGEYLVADG